MNGEFRARRPMLGRCLGGVWVLLGLLAGASFAQETVPAGQAEVRVPLARAAMAWHYRQTRDPGLLAEQMFAEELYYQDASHEEIVNRTLAKRREWAALKETATTGVWRADKYATAAVRGLGRLASSYLQGGSVGVEVANLGIMVFEDLMAGHAVPRATQRLVEAMQEQENSLARPEDNVFAFVERTYAENPEFRRTWNELFLERYGFTPDASDQTVTDRVPDFSDHQSIARIRDALNEGGDQREALLDEVRRNWEEARMQWAQENEEAARRQEERRAAFDAAGYRSAVDLAATVIGFDDPALGRRIHATNEAVFRVRDAIEAFEATQGAGASVTLASFALTGNVVGASLMLMNAFGDSGPSADEIIIEELGKLREEVQEIRKEMHDRFEEIRGEMHQRFDGVHDHLDGIHADTVEAFNVLLGEGRRGHEQVVNGLENARLQLAGIAGTQLDTQIILVRVGELLTGLVEGLQMAPCFRPHSPEDGDPMTVSKYRDCRAWIETLGYRLPDKQLLGEQPAVGATLPFWLDVRPDGTISQSFEEFKRLLRATGPEGADRAAALAETVVGPDAWFYVVDKHDWFLSEYPEHASTDDGTGFVRTMRVWRDDLTSYAEAIRDELVAFQEGSRPTVFSKLLDEAWNREEMETLLATIADFPGVAMLNCYEEARREVSLERGDLNVCEENRYAEQVRDRLLAREELGNMERTLSVAGAHLRSWISFALHDAIGHSDVATAVARGWIGFPDLRYMIESEGLGWTWTSWTLADDVSARIRDLGEQLRSAAMREAVTHEYGHHVLMRTHFANLDGGDGEREQNR